MRESKDPKHLRLRMVQTARRHGVKPTARLFACSPNTVRKWLARYDGTLASLADRSRAPIHRPRKLSPEAEKQILRAKKRLPTWGAKRLKFNYVRANSGKEHKCPWQLVREKNPNNRIDLLYLTPVFLQDLLRTRLPRTPRGHHVRGHPWRVSRLRPAPEAAA